MEQYRLMLSHFLLNLLLNLSNRRQLEDNAFYLLGLGTTKKNKAKTSSFIVS